jgi:uncharacterized membrane protein HdeD (DUF308 family)
MEAAMNEPDLTNDEIRAATSAWWLLVLIGLVGIAAGVVVLLKPEDSLSFLAVVAGVFILASGIFDVAISFSRRTPNRGMAAIVGVLSTVIGILLIRHPIGGVLFVALLIGIWLIAVGVVRFVEAFDSDRRTWGIVVALIEIVAGVVIVATPPIGFATLALLTGIAFILNGVAIFALGWIMHTVRHEAEGTAYQAGAPA